MGTRGFSLLEMLTVVAVAAVVAAFVFPFYRDSIDRAGTAKCATNLRNITAAALAWTADHDGRLPDRSRWYSTSKGDTYSLLPYLGTPDTGQKIYTANVFTCPSFHRRYPTTASPVRTYAINRYATGSLVDDDAEWQKILATEPPLRLQRVAQPSRMMFFMDGKPNAGNLSGAAPSAAYRGYSAIDSIAADSVPHLHERGLNAAFLDGHVERVTTEWIEEQALDSRRTNVFWGAGK